MHNEALKVIYFTTFPIMPQLSLFSKNLNDYLSKMFSILKTPLKLAGELIKEEFFGSLNYFKD